MRILTFILGVMQTNCYFLIDEETGNTAIVDPAAEYEKIMTKIKERGLHIAYILLTHAHFDHLMALEELRAATGAPVYIHEHDAEALMDPELSYMKQFGGVNKSCRSADRLLEDGDQLQLGSNTIRVLHTPGHTMGSVCYITDVGIITGDTIFRGNIGRYDLYGGDYRQILESLKLLDALEGDYKLYPGHGSSTRLDAERSTNPYMMHN